jgi:glycosyltransferase involved in cell wall biosynthesis
VRNIADPDRPVALQILDNGVPVARVLANRYRPDLTRTKPGSGRYGFEVDIPGGLSPLTRHVITFGREPDGVLLGGPPFIIEAADSFTPAVEQAIAAAVATVVPGAQQARMLAFFTAQAERLRQSGADREAHRAERQAGQRVRRREARAPRDPELRALVIDERVPVAGRDAGSQAMLSHMHALRRLGYAVSFVAAEEMSADAAALTQDGIVPCVAPFYGSVEDVLRRQAGCFDVVYLHRAEIAASYLALARRCNPRARIVYSVADLHHVRLERQAAIEDRPEVLAESRRLKLAEIVAACSANTVITHSLAEVGVLRRLAPRAAVHRVAWDVPVAATRTRFAARYGIAFIGAYSHAPNVDAAHFLVEAIMPLVWQRDPSIECRLIGTDMPKSVRRLARPGVVAVGAVADLDAAVFDRVRLTVAPLRYGAGINGKVLASLAAGVPCVMSEVAAEGMTLCPTLGGLVGTDAATLAALIRDLHADRAASGRAAKAGMAMIRRDFSVDAVDAALARAIAGAPVRGAVAA